MAAEWADKKHILGMPISFTWYRLEDGRLYLRQGFFRTVEHETLLYRILDISLERTLGDKIFRVGTVVLHCADKTHPELRIENIRRPEAVRAMLSERIEAARERSRVTGREMYGTAQNELDVDLEDNDGE